MGRARIGSRLRVTVRCASMPSRTSRSALWIVLLLEAGSFSSGLTLTMADTCFILEPQRDKGIEDQIENRIYRPGQLAAEVRIIKLFMNGTIEQRIIDARRERAASPWPIFGLNGSSDESESD
jgi:hypothetical protein